MVLGRADGVAGEGDVGGQFFLFFDLKKKERHRLRKRKVEVTMTIENRKQKGIDYVVTACIFL